MPSSYSAIMVLSFTPETYIAFGPFKGNISIRKLLGRVPIERTLSDIFTHKIILKYARTLKVKIV
jgi:hypothetical protein